MTNFSIQPMIDQLPDRSFIRQYSGYASTLTDAYPEYHLHNALALLSAVTARRLYVHLTIGKIYPNLWTLSLGQSSTSKKTTAMSIAQSIYEGARYNSESIPLMLPAETSPQGLISDLAQIRTYTTAKGEEVVVENPLKHPAQRPFWRDEWSGFVEILKRGWAEALKTLLMSLYDCGDYYKRVLRKEQIELFDIYLPINAATTPVGLAALTQHPGDYVSGWLPRFLVTYPRYMKPTRAVGLYTGEMQSNRNEIVGQLVKIDACLGDMERRIDLSDDALRIWNEWIESNQEELMSDEDNELEATIFARLGVYAVKLAVLVHLSDAYPDATFGAISPVSGDTMSCAIRLIDEFYYPDALEFGELTRITDERNSVDKVEAIVRKYSPILHSRALRNSHLKAADFKDAIDTLVDREDIKVKIEESMGKPKIIYFYKNDEDDSQISHDSISYHSSLDSRRAGIDSSHENNSKGEPANSANSGELSEICEPANHANDVNHIEHKFKKEDIIKACEHIPEEEIVHDLKRLKDAYVHKKNLHSVEDINIKDFLIYIFIQEPKYGQFEIQRDRVGYILINKPELWKYGSPDI